MLSEYRAPLIRSLVYGVIATLISVIISYPMAYWIAFYGGRNKSTYLFLVLLPFFVTFVLRTVAWEFLLGDQGLVLSWLKERRHRRVRVPRPGDRAGRHRWPGLQLHAVHAAADLRGAWRRSTSRCSRRPATSTRPDARRSCASCSRSTVPGIFAGVLLTFVPAVSDYVNASILGGTDQTMIGNIIQTLYLTNSDYPDASALSIVLMAILLVGIFIYAKALGTQDLLDAAAG